MLERNKVVLMGLEGVGKSCLLKRLQTGRFSEVETTIGAAFGSHKVKVKDKIVRMSIWDTAGQERYNGLLPMYIRDSIAVVICTSSPKKNIVIKFLEKCRDSEKDCFCFVAVTKSDTISDRKSYEKLENYTDENNVPFIFTSSVSGENIENLFYDIASVICDDEKNPKEKNYGIQLESVVSKNRCCW